MGQNTYPIFTCTPVNAVGVLSAANTLLDGSGTIVTIATGDADGSRINSILIQALGITTAGMVRLFLKPSGGSWRLWREIAVSAITPSASVAAFAYNLVPPEGPLMLASGDQLGAAPHNAEPFNVFAHGGNF